MEYNICTSFAFPQVQLEQSPLLENLINSVHNLELNMVTSLGDNSRGFQSGIVIQMVTMTLIPWSMQNPAEKEPYLRLCAGRPGTGLMYCASDMLD